MRYERKWGIMQVNKRVRKKGNKLDPKAVPQTKSMLNYCFENSGFNGLQIKKFRRNNLNFPRHHTQIKNMAQNEINLATEDKKCA